MHDQPLEITYLGARGTTQRRIRTSGVLIERTMTLLNCRDLDVDADRQFQLHRIRKAEVSPDPE